MLDLNQPAPLEFWFDFGSNYSYLSAMRIEALAARHQVPLLWRPFLLGPIFRSFGWETSPFVLQKAKGAYVWRDMERECAKAGLAWRRPSEFPRSAVLPSRLALLGASQPWIGAFCRQIMQRNFVDDQAIDNEALVLDCLNELSLPASTLLAAARTDANKLALRQQTELAMKRGLFGAPSFVVAGELFWGNDRLDDAMAAAVARGR